MKHGQRIAIDYLPIGMRYKIIELEQGLENYKTDITTGTVTNQSREIERTITQKGQMIEVEYTNRLQLYNLPHTGGFGITLYTIADALCIIFGTSFMYKKKLRERRVDGSS